MRIHSPFLPSLLAATLSLLLLGSCASKEKKEPEEQDLFSAHEETQRTIIDPGLLPNRFRQTGYIIKEQDTSSSIVGKDIGALDSFQIKVGANISTRDPITLREAMRALVRTKNMSLSWAPDVNQDLLVDIDVRADDNFYDAIDQILRQLDYFHEVEGTTVVIKYRESKQYHIAMPFIKQDYTSSTGSKTGAITSSGNVFDIWDNIQKNIDSIIATWRATVVTPEVQTPKPESEQEGEEEVAAAPLSRRVSSTESTYTIDKPVGLITIHAPKSLQKRISNYLATLEKELYKQIIIEAKIIEVQLSDNSSLGINWHQILQGLHFEGLGYGRSTFYGREDGQEQRSDFSNIYTDTRTSNTSRSSTTGTTSSSGTDGSTTSTQTSSNDSATGMEGSTSASATGMTGQDILGSTFADGMTSSSSSSSLTGRNISDALSMGATAATFITSGGGMAETLATGVSLMGFNFTTFIKALQEQGQTSVLSNPKISVMNGQPALISVGRDVTYIKAVTTEITGASGAMSTTVATENILSGIGMALSAVVRGDDEIVMNLVPITSELSEPIEYVEIGQGNRIGLPIVNKREMNTTVKIKDGSMLVVGGLISEFETKDGSFLPGTRNIPYLKYLFGYEEKKKRKRELIILLRPRIIH
jgi:type II secretory pathway component GspD/PulD (secretin)